MNNVIELNLDNAQSVIAQSAERLVLVEFYAAAEPQCHEMSASLARIAAQYPETLLLARVDVQQQPQLAAHFAIQALPTVYVLQNGRPVDGFAGPTPEAQIREKLAAFLPSASEQALQQAQLLQQQGDHPAAISVLKQALELESNSALKIALAQAYLAIGRSSDAETLLNQIPLADQYDSAYQRAKAELDLALQAADTPEIQQLNEALARDPHNADLAYSLAVALTGVQRHEESLQLLLALLQQDLNARNGEVKKTFLDICQTLGNGDTVASRYRRALFSLLY